MFVAARAFIIAQQKNYIMITPTWAKLSPGPYLRREKDKRLYIGLFKSYGISGFKKAFFLLTKKKIDLNLCHSQLGIVHIEGLHNYFEDLLPHQSLVKSYFNQIIRPDAIGLLSKFDFTNTIGIHIRLGDYIPELRTNISWYIQIVNKIELLHKNRFRYLIFSDGKDDEFRSLLELPRTVRVFFGNALADIVALSRCHFIIGSDSTFSGWGAFLGQRPAIFPRKHFGQVLLNGNNELSIENINELSEEYLKKVLSECCSF
jgi:hypothetical protein